MLRISRQDQLPIYSVSATREFERRAQEALPPHTLMQRAGLASARLTLALSPHAQCIWIAAGPGNNGGDGFEAAYRLKQLGKNVVLTWSAQHEPDSNHPVDAAASRARALAAGVQISARPPETFDFALDALLGIGATRPMESTDQSPLAKWLARLRESSAPVLALDVPTGLDADTGNDHANFPSARDFRGAVAGRRYCLSFLTLKPGLFTASGRDLAGQVWLDTLGLDPPDDVIPSAWWQGTGSAPEAGRGSTRHASHKGTFGDVAVLGGESLAGGASMEGAALLAARAALHAGAGRVLVSLLCNTGRTSDAVQPELMFRPADAIDFQHQVVVCGCGGGQSIRAHLPAVLSRATRAVLDADALNAVAGDPQLQVQLKARGTRANYQTVLTPHPLEAARLLGGSAQQVQADRLAAARNLAEQFNCVVVLKGSGTVLAAPGHTPVINGSGNALLATAGTGDVLAGVIGAYLAAGAEPWPAACRATWQHGAAADAWAASGHGNFTASTLAGLMGR